MILTAMGKGSAASALYPDFVGKRAIFVGSGVGPSAVTSTSVDPISLAIPNYYIDAVLDGASTDGKYYIQAYPSQTGPRGTWNCYYFNLPAGTQVTTGNLSTSTFVVSAFVGQY